MNEESFSADRRTLLKGAAASAALLSPGAALAQSRRDSDREAIKAQQHQAARWTYIGSGMVHDAKTLARLLQDEFPGKPIRYVVPTHHHSDHFNGVRTRDNLYQQDRAAMKAGNFTGINGTPEYVRSACDASR